VYRIPTSLANFRIFIWCGQLCKPLNVFSCFKDALALMQWSSCMHELARQYYRGPKWCSLDRTWSSLADLGYVTVPMQWIHTASVLTLAAWLCVCGHLSMRVCVWSLIYACGWSGCRMLWGCRLLWCWRKPNCSVPRYHNVTFAALDSWLVCRNTTDHCRSAQIPEIAYVSDHRSVYGTADH